MRLSKLLPFLLLVSQGYATPPGKGHLLLVGGGSKPPEVLRKFVELAGGPEAPIVILPTASGEPDTGEYYVKLFQETTGARNVTPLEIRSRLDAYRPRVVRTLEEAGGIFFSGGDQSRITEVFLGTPAYAAIRRALEAGAVIGGTSAGTACMSSSMLNGQGDEGVLQSANMELVPGMGFWPGVLVDQHFVARRRQNRLLSVVLENPGLLGLGIDEATAAWIKPDGTLEVMGSGWIWVYDARKAAVKRRENRLGVRDLRVHVLISGDHMNLHTGEPSSSPGSVQGSFTRSLAHSTQSTVDCSKKSRERFSGKR